MTLFTYSRPIRHKLLADSNLNCDLAVQRVMIKGLFLLQIQTQNAYHSKPNIDRLVQQLFSLGLVDNVMNTGLEGPRLIFLNSLPKLSE